MILGFVALFALYCSKKTRTSVPLNYFLLAVFTWMETVSIAAYTAELEIFSVLLSIAAFCLVTGCLFFSAMVTTISQQLFRNLIFGVVLACILQTIFWIVLMVGGFSEYLVAAWAILGVFITGFYIIIDLW